jgi:hypothetical protein
MSEFDNRRNMEDDDNRVPDVKENEVSEKTVILIIVGLFIWIMTFLILKLTGVISPMVMRICIYPVLGLIVIAYLVVKSRGNNIM